MKHFLQLFFSISAVFILFCPVSGHAADYTNPLGMTFTRIDSGTFEMGSPSDEVGRSTDETLHTVTLTQDFFMQTTEVTQAQWQAVMGDNSNPSRFQNCGPDCPVENVSWEEAQEFIRELNRQRFGTYALPTEAQWEYAARAGTNTAFAADGGDLPFRIKCETFEPLAEMGWYCNNGMRRTHEVASLDPNAWGLFDMHGNVREWVNDHYGEYPEGPVEDPEGASSGQRVMRGGGYDDFSYFCRSAMRLRLPEGESRDDLGFRLVMTDFDDDAACEYTVDRVTRPLPASENTVTVSVEAANSASPCSFRTSSWISYTKEDWITLTPTRTRGGGTVDITVTENLEAPDRRGTVYIAGKEVTLEQEGFVACSYEISPDQAVFSPGGETMSFDVTTSSPECSWTVSRPDTLNWVRVSPASGTGASTVTITVNPNSGDFREGTLTIAEQTLDITQGSESSCFYNPIPSRQTFTASETSSLVRVVVTPENCSWSASSNGHDWIRLHPASQVTGAGTLTLSVTPNTGGAREGTVTIAGKDIPITQEAAPDSGLTTTQVSRLYAAIFGRASDGQGNAFWKTFPDAGTAAQEILNTQDAKDYFGTGLNTNQDFIEHIYSNTLGKTIDDDPAGIAFWVDQLENGAGRGQVVAALVATIESFAPGQPNYNKDDVATITAFNQFTNRVTVSDYMAEEKFFPARSLDDTRFGPDGLNVTHEVTTVQDAKTKVDQLETEDPGDEPGPGPGDDDDPGPGPGDGTQITADFGMTFNKILSGTFIMGSPETEKGRDPDETRQEITLEHDFFIQTTEVTQGQWKAVMEDNPSYFDDCGDDCPVEKVSWTEVQDFIARLNALGTGIYRLPTEAEWEYAARAGSGAAFANGGINEEFCKKDWVLDPLGWYCYNSGNKTHPVAEKNPNKWGLVDMHGNVSEWVFDLYPEPPEDHAIIRGGSWHSFAKDCRSAARDSRWMDYKAPDIGFRLIYAPAVDSNLE